MSKAIIHLFVGVIVALTFLFVGCAPHKHATTPSGPQWKPSPRCKMMAKHVTPSYVLAVQHHCLNENVVTLVIAFLGPYKKHFADEIGAKIREMLGVVTLKLLTTGRMNGHPFFLFVVTDN